MRKYYKFGKIYYVYANGNEKSEPLNYYLGIKDITPQRKKNFGAITEFRMALNNIKNNQEFVFLTSNENYEKMNRMI